MSHYPHEWLPTGLYINGVLCVPCAQPGCDAALCYEATGEVVREGVFPQDVAGLRLDIEDDPRGGVAKIILHEITNSYLLNQIEFERGDIALDIGAHVGIVSVYLAAKHPDIAIYAFEPMPDNYKRLLRNLRANRISNVRASNKALSGNGRSLLLRGNPSQNTGGASAFSVTASESAHRAESVTLGQVFSDLGIDRCRLLKLDAEGAEYEIIAADPALLSRVDYLVGEFHYNDTLAEMGYSPQQLLEMCRQYIPADHLHITTCRMGD